MSRFDRKDPGVDPEYCNGLGRARKAKYPDGIHCAYCGNEMEKPPVMSSHPMCPTCRDKHLGIAVPAATQGAA